MTLDQILTVRKFPDPNTSEDVLTKNSSLGGTGPNIAVAAARLGCPTALCALVGTDFPEAQRRFIEASGVIMDEFVTVEGCETSTAVVVNDPGLTQKVLFFQGPQGIASELGVELRSNARRSKYVHFCTGDPEFYIDTMLAVDGPRKAIDPAQESHRIWNADNFNRALPLADAVFCNNFEAESLSRYAGAVDILDLDKGLVVCTMGSKGSVAKVGGEVLRIPAVQADRVVDATGCGDTYRAGFYAALYRGYAVPEALVVAAAVASFVIEETGALTNVPTWDMAEARAEPYLGKICRRPRRGFRTPSEGIGTPSSWSIVLWSGVISLRTHLSPTRETFSFPISDITSMADMRSSMVPALMRDSSSLRTATAMNSWRNAPLASFTLEKNRAPSSRSSLNCLR